MGDKGTPFVSISYPNLFNLIFKNSLPIYIVASFAADGRRSGSNRVSLVTHRGGATGKSGSTTYSNIGEAWQGSMLCARSVCRCAVVAGASEGGDFGRCNGMVLLQ